MDYYSGEEYDVFVRQTMWWEEEKDDAVVYKTPVEFQEEKDYEVDDLVYDEKYDYLWQVINTNGLQNEMVETEIKKTRKRIAVRENEQGVFELVITDEAPTVDSLSVLYKRAYLQNEADAASAKKFKEEFAKISLWQHMLNLFLFQVVPNYDTILAGKIKEILDSAFKEDKEGWITVRKNGSGEAFQYRFFDSKVSFESNGETYNLTRDEFLEFLDDQEKNKYKGFPIRYKNEEYTKDNLQKLEKNLDKTEFKIIELGQYYILDDQLIKKLNKEQFEQYLQESEAKYELGDSFGEVKTALVKFYKDLFSYELYVDNQPLVGSEYYPAQVVQQLGRRMDGVYADVATGRQFVVKSKEVYLTYETNGEYQSAYKFLNKGKEDETKEVEKFKFNTDRPELQWHYNDVYDETKRMLDYMLQERNAAYVDDRYVRNVDSRMLENLDDENNDFFRFGDLASKGSDGLRSMSKKASQPAQWLKSSLLLEFLRYNDPEKNPQQSNFMNFQKSTKGTELTHYLRKQKSFVKLLNKILPELDEAITDEDYRKKPHLLSYFAEDDYKKIIDDFVSKLTKTKKRDKAEALFYFLNGFFTRDEDKVLFTGRIERLEDKDDDDDDLQDIRLSFCLFESFLFHLFSELVQTQDTYRKFLKKIVGKRVVLEPSQVRTSPNVLRSPAPEDAIVVESIDGDRLTLSNGESKSINDYGKTFWGLSWSDKIAKYVDDDYFFALENFMDLVFYWKYAFDVFSYLNDKLLEGLDSKFKLLYASNVADTLAGVMEELLPADNEAYQTIFKNEVKTRYGRKVKLTKKADALAQDTSKLEAVSLKTRLKIGREKYKTIVVPFKGRVNNIGIKIAAKRLQSQTAYCFYQAFERTGEDPGTLELPEFDVVLSEFLLPRLKVSNVNVQCIFFKMKDKLEEIKLKGDQRLKEIYYNLYTDSIETLLYTFLQESKQVFSPDRVFVSTEEINESELEKLLMENTPKETKSKNIIELARGIQPSAQDWKLSTEALWFVTFVET